VSSNQSILNELEDMIASHDIGYRARILRRITDLFAVNAGKISDEQMALFDEVMTRLVEEIDASARATFGHTLADVADAPPNVVRRLALDDAIDVAAPLLTRSPQVDDGTLIKSAREKSQAHLLAISRRKRLNEPVTDILVGRGDQDVVLSTASNPGAAFSDLGYSTLIERSSDDDRLAVSVWVRQDIPRQHLLKLFADASEAVKLKLIRADPGRTSVILDIVAHASQKIQARTRERSANYTAATAMVGSLSEQGGLTEAQLVDFARAGRFDETAIALAMICDLPVSLIERALVDEQPGQIMVLARASGMSWPTTKTLLMLQGSSARSPHRQSQDYEAFMRLKVETAKRVIQFYRLREQTTTPLA